MKKTLAQRVEIAEENIDELKKHAKKQVEGVREGFRQLYEKTLDDDHLDHKSEVYEEGDEDAPFFSEAYLYNLLGKEDARSVLAWLHQIEECVGYRDGRIFLFDDRR